MTDKILYTCSACTEGFFSLERKTRHEKRCEGSMTLKAKRKQLRRSFSDMTTEEQKLARRAFRKENMEEIIEARKVRENNRINT